MMGQQSGIQEQLFFCFSIENHVPKEGMPSLIIPCFSKNRYGRFRES
jgi:hypothetical protein